MKSNALINSKTSSSRTLLFLSIISIFSNTVIAQSTTKNSKDVFVNDTALHIEYLPEITLVGRGEKRDILMLPEVVGTKINAGKKNSLVVVEELNTIVVNNNMRQIMAKVPGIHVWESDGSGIQIGIATRGLSPNRSWEFNVRQNGADISSDPYGYPEAYYNPPMQAVQRIQLIRGAGSLQYGSQFGGMINYIMKDGADLKKPLQIDANQTMGSFGMTNSFLSLGGKQGRVNYFAFADTRKADGWRKNSQYSTQTYFGSITYRITEKSQITAEYTRFNMLSQQPGGLNETQFLADAQQSLRARNWFSTPWQTGNVKYLLEINKNQRLQLQAFGMQAVRSSVGFMQGITTKDTINKLTNTYNTRDLAIDKYKNFGIEASYLINYTVAGSKQTLSTGIRAFNSETQRFQKGIGSVGSDANFNNQVAKFPTELQFNTLNYAWFAEQVIRIGKSLTIIPGVRAENIQSEVSGRLSFNSAGEAVKVVSAPINRSFFIGGIASEYHFKNGLEMYGNITQAYRPILFSDMQATPGIEVVDANMKDATGFNSDLGVRGRFGNWLYVDGSVYWLQYNNRPGRLTQYDDQGKSYTLKTNVGSSVSKGAELVVDADVIRRAKKNAKFYFPIFVSAAYNDARYQDFLISVKGSDGKMVSSSLKDNRVENAPEWIIRAGSSVFINSMKHMDRHLKIGVQYNYVSDVFTDAQNTVVASSNGQNGLIPAYSIWDLNATYQFNKSISFKATINNLTNERYFTRRAGGYPGPGLMPSDARSILFSVNVTL